MRRFFVHSINKKGRAVSKKGETGYINSGIWGQTSESADKVGRGGGAEPPRMRRLCAARPARPLRAGRRIRLRLSPSSV